MNVETELRNKIVRLEERLDECNSHRQSMINEDLKLMKQIEELKLEAIEERASYEAATERLNREIELLRSYCDDICTAEVDNILEQEEIL